jgi:hypothetical protein
MPEAMLRRYVWGGHRAIATTPTQACTQHHALDGMQSRVVSVSWPVCVVVVSAKNSRAGPRIDAHPVVGREGEVGSDSGRHGWLREEIEPQRLLGNIVPGGCVATDIVLVGLARACAVDAATVH